MSEQSRTELQRLEVLRLSNAESNKITRVCIETALILLMKDSHISDITITDIVKKAGVSRTAYYRNYSSKEDILRSMIDDIASKVIMAMQLQFPLTNTYDYWFSLFNTLQEHYEDLHILLKANFGESVRNQVQHLLVSTIQKEDVAELYKFYFWSGAIYSVINQWILDSGQPAPEDMAHMCYGIIASMNEGCVSNHEFLK
mgnify:CR=1 FL=1